MKNIIKTLCIAGLLALAIVGCKKPHQEVQVTIRLNKELITSLPVGSEQTLVATVKPEGVDVTVIWSSDNEKVVVVNDEGVVTGVTQGTAVITAKADDAVATCKVTVTAVKPTKIELSSRTLELTVGTEHALEVRFTPENAVADDITWNTTDDKVVTVKDGLVKAVAKGDATITVKCSDGELAAACKVKVIEENTVIRPVGIEVTPKSLELKVGDKSTLTATVTPADAEVNDLVWETSDNTVATVAHGEVTALNAGEAVITAKCNNGELSSSCKVTVTKDEKPEPEPDKLIAVTIVSVDGKADVQVGEHLNLKAVYTPSDANPNSVSWTVDNESLATIDQNGVVKGVNASKGTDNNWMEVVVTVTADGLSNSMRVRVIPKQAEDIQFSVPENNSIRIGSGWRFEPKVYPEGLGFGVLAISDPFGNISDGYYTNPSVPGRYSYIFTLANHENLVNEYNLSRSVSLDVIPYWVETVSLPESQSMEAGSSLILTPVFTSDVEGHQPTYKDLVWSSSDEAKAVVDKNGKVTALAAGTVEITATTAGSWSVPSGEQQKSAKCTVTISEAAYAIKVGDFYFSDGTTSSTLQSGKTVIGIVISRDNATSTDKKLPAGCTHGVALALGEGSGNWSSSYDAGRVNSWATENGYENTTGTYYSNAHWAYVRNEYGNRLLGYNNTSALKAYIKNNGYTSGILDALAAYQIALPETASELYIPSIAEMDAVAKNLEVINAALEAAGGTKFVMDTADSQKDAYWTTSENEASSGNAATINPFTGELHGGVMKSKEKKVRFIFAF